MCLWITSILCMVLLLMVFGFNRIAVQLRDSTLFLTYSSMNIIARTLAELDEVSVDPTDFVIAASNRSSPTVTFSVTG